LDSTTGNYSCTLCREEFVYSIDEEKNESAQSAFFGEWKRKGSVFMTTKNNIQTQGLPGRLRSSLPWQTAPCGGVLNVFAEEIQGDSQEGEVLLLLAFSPNTSKLGGNFPAPPLLLAGTPDHRRRFSTKTKKQVSILNNIFLRYAKDLIGFNFFALPRDFRNEFHLLSNAKVALWSH